MTVRTRIVIGFILIAGLGIYFLTDWMLNDLRFHYLKSMEDSLVDTSILLSSLVATEVQENRINTNPLRKALDDAYKRKFTATRVASFQ